MKLSRYTFTCPAGQDVLLYNALSGALAKVSRQAWAERESDPDFMQQLRQQGFVVDDGADELALYKLRYYGSMFGRNKEFGLIIAPTMQCNFSCSYCFEGAHKRAGLMTDEVENALIDVMLAHRKKPISITWYGGEPLLGHSRMLSISRRLEAEGVAFESKMLTNGSLLTPEVVDSLAALRMTFIQLSMDGTAHDHDRRRHFRGGAPSFDRIIRNLGDVLARTDVKVSVRVAVDKQNPHAYDELKTYLAEKFPDAMASGRLGVAHSHVLDRTGFDAAGAVCYTLQEIFEQGLARLQEGRAPEGFSVVPERALPCMFRQPAVLNVDSEGYLYHCLELFGNPDYRIGNILDKKVDYAMLAQGMFIKDPFDDATCRQCKVLPLCGGGCPAVRMKLWDTERQEQCCSLYRGRVEQLMPYMYEQMKK